MYSIDDKSAAIKSIQKLLRVNPTGVFDKNTINAVAETQKRNGLEVSGRVDYITFLAILAEYKLFLSSNLPNEISLLNSNRQYKFGDYGVEVERINSLLGAIISEYRVEHRIPRGPYFNHDTVAAIKAVRKIFGMSDSSTLDSRLYNRIFQESESIKIKNQFK